MGKARKHTPEQIVNILQQLAIEMATGTTHSVARRETSPSEQACYNWRKQYGGLKANQARQLKEHEQEISKLKRLVTELRLDKQILQNLARRTS